MIVRKARLRDLHDIYDIEKTSFGDAAFSMRAMTYHLTNNLVLCSEIDGEICGYICFSPLTKTKRRRVYSIAVHPSYRKNGVARELMLVGERRSKADQIYLEVDETNHGAIRLYDSLGYVVFGRYKKYYGKTDALRMRKLI